MSMSYRTHQNTITYTGDREGHVGYAFEFYARQKHNIEKTTGHDDDGWCPDSGQTVEMKVTKRKTNRGAGRLILRHHQHRALFEEDRDYILGIYEGPFISLTGCKEWVVKAHCRIPARDLHEACKIPDHSNEWVMRRTRTGYYYEYGLLWTDVPRLGRGLAERQDD